MEENIRGHDEWQYLQSGWNNVHIHKEYHIPRVKDATVGKKNSVNSQDERQFWIFTVRICNKIHRQDERQVFTGRTT